MIGLVRLPALVALAFLGLALAGRPATRAESVAQRPATDKPAPKPDRDLEMAKARKLLAAGKIDAALAAIQALQAHYPSDTAVTELMTEIEVAEVEQMRTAEVNRRKKLFKSMKGAATFTIDDVTVEQAKIYTSGRWAFDRRDKEKESLAAKKGTRYVVVDYSIRSKSPDPVLPPVALYSVEEDEAHLINGFATAFFQWESEETFSGSKDDNGNDLAHAENVKLTSGLAVSKSALGRKTLLVVMHKYPCFVRRPRTDASPPFYYEAFNCTLPAMATPGQLLEDFELIKVLK